MANWFLLFCDCHTNTTNEAENKTFLMERIEGFAVWHNSAIAFWCAGTTDRDKCQRKVGTSTLQRRTSTLAHGHPFSSSRTSSVLNSWETIHSDLPLAVSEALSRPVMFIHRRQQCTVKTQTTIEVWNKTNDFPPAFSNVSLFALIACESARFNWIFTRHAIGLDFCFAYLIDFLHAHVAQCCFECENYSRTS